MIYQMMPIKTILIDTGVIEELPKVVSNLGIESKIMVVADKNTYQAAGRRVTNLLIDSGYNVRACILCIRGKLAADEQALGETLINMDVDTELLLAVGSGTINDITRYLSYKTGKPYAVVPTAPSMDGYASSVAAMTVNGCKKTYSATPPKAIVADIDILSEAPKEMIRAGLGDILGKYTSLADWKLGQIIAGEAYSEDIENLVRHAVDECINISDCLFTKKTIKSLMQALVTSGIAMLNWGNSRPASGSEHHISHFWEMHDALQGTEGHLHGAKVGIAEIWITKLYHKVFALDINEVKHYIAIRQPEREAAYIERVKKAYGPLADEIINELKDSYLDEQKRQARQENIIKNWEVLQSWVRENVPPPERIQELLKKAGAPTSHLEMGIAEEMLLKALDNAKEVRARYTIFRLAEDIGLWPVSRFIS